MKTATLKGENGFFHVANLLVMMLKDRDNYIAYSPALKIYGLANNDEKAIKNFEKNLSIFFKIYQRNGKLAQKMNSLGWIKTDNTIMPPVSPSIPHELLLKNSRAPRTMNIEVPRYSSVG